jgi:hypothetical protein
MNQFASMTTQQFCNWVACNPGGAQKAYQLRVKDNPECDNTAPKVITKKEFIETIVEKVVIQESVVVRTEIKYVTSWVWVIDVVNKVGEVVSSLLPETQLTLGVYQ